MLQALPSHCSFHKEERQYTETHLVATKEVTNLEEWVQNGCIMGCLSSKQMVFFTRPCDMLKKQTFKNAEGRVPFLVDGTMKVKTKDQVGKGLGTLEPSHSLVSQCEIKRNHPQRKGRVYADLERLWLYF